MPPQGSNLEFPDSESGVIPLDQEAVKWKRRWGSNPQRTRFKVGGVYQFLYSAIGVGAVVVPQRLLEVVGPAGFEPAIFAVRRRRPEPD